LYEINTYFTNQKFKNNINSNSQDSNNEKSKIGAQQKSQNIDNVKNLYDHIDTFMCDENSVENFDITVNDTVIKTVTGSTHDVMDFRNFKNGAWIFNYEKVEIHTKIDSHEVQELDIRNYIRDLRINDIKEKCAATNDESDDEKIVTYINLSDEKKDFINEWLTKSKYKFNNPGDSYLRSKPSLLLLRNDNFIFSRYKLEKNKDFMNAMKKQTKDVIVTNDSTFIINKNSSQDYEQVKPAKPMNRETVIEEMGQDDEYGPLYSFSEGKLFKIIISPKYICNFARV